MKTESLITSVIYSTGCTPKGVPLLGGIWKLWTQEGFPIEMSHLICKQQGWLVDWLEAMADASCTNDCPALMKHIESFLGDDDIANLKVGFMRVLGTGISYEQIVEEKRANGAAFDQFICEALKKHAHTL